MSVLGHLQCLHLKLPNSGFQTHEPSTKNYKIGLKLWSGFGFFCLLFFFFNKLFGSCTAFWMLSFGTDFMAHFQAFYKHAKGLELTHLFLIVINWNGDVIS